MITRILFIDFDATLADSPMPDVGKNIWLKKTGQEYPHIGWWGRKESLNNEVFDIKLFDEVKRVLDEGNRDPNTVSVLLTSRVSKLLPEILTVLEANDAKFDHYSLKENNKDKNVRIKEFIKQYPSVSQIDIYDDRDKEFAVFKNLESEIGDLFEINIFKCINGSVSLFDGVTVNEAVEIIKEVISEGMSEIKKQVLRARGISDPMKDKILKYLTSSTEYNTGLIKPLRKEEKFISKTKKSSGVSVGGDKKGFYVYTHRSRSNSYPTQLEIPKEVIEKIEATG